MALADRGDDLGALDAYLAAIRVQPQWDAPWYNKGLVHKYRGEWRESLEANLQASRLAATNEAAIWNTGIAATALGEWAQARQCWSPAFQRQRWTRSWVLPATQICRPRTGQHIPGYCARPAPKGDRLSREGTITGRQ